MGHRSVDGRRRFAPRECADPGSMAERSNPNVGSRSRTDSNDEKPVGTRLHRWCRWSRPWRLGIVIDRFVEPCDDRGVDQARRWHSRRSRRSRFAAPGFLPWRSWPGLPRSEAAGTIFGGPTWPPTTWPGPSPRRQSPRGSAAWCVKRSGSRRNEGLGSRTGETANVPAGSCST